MLITMDPSVRASRVGYNACLRRVGDYGLRAGVTRAALVVVMFITVVVTDASAWTWPCIGIGLLGVYLALTDNYYTEHGGEPREPLARWSFHVAYKSLGRGAPNIPGLIEALAYVPLALVGSWLMIGNPVEARLICVACAVGFIASCLSAIAVDPAFYNPEVRFNRVTEILRATVGFIAIALAAAVILSAPWDTISWWFAAALCGSLVLVQLRIRETDRAFAAARGFADNEQVVGRQTITRHMHSMVGTPLEAMNAAVLRYRGQDPDLFDAYRTVVGGYRELLGMDQAADLDVEWPGLLGSHLRALGGRYGTLFRFNHPEHPLHRTDRVLAHLVLDDLATNAARAGASECQIGLLLIDGLYVATAIDDGRPIDLSVWMRAGGGLQRLAGALEKLGGGIEFEALAHGRKRVVARWRARGDEPLDGTHPQRRNRSSC